MLSFLKDATLAFIISLAVFVSFIQSSTVVVVVTVFKGRLYNTELLIGSYPLLLLLNIWCTLHSSLFQGGRERHSLWLIKVLGTFFGGQNERAVRSNLFCRLLELFFLLLVVVVAALLLLSRVEKRVNLSFCW